MMVMSDARWLARSDNITVYLALAGVSRQHGGAMERRTFINTVAASSAAAALSDRPLEAAQAQQPKPTKVTLLGTGTPAPSLQRVGSGYLIEVGNDRIIRDHGPDAHHRLLESGRRAVDITHAFFTHLHYDHCMDYGRLVLQRWDQGADRIPDLQVYGPTPIQTHDRATLRRGRRLWS